VVEDRGEVVVGCVAIVVSRWPFLGAKKWDGGLDFIFAVLQTAERFTSTITKSGTRKSKSGGECVGGVFRGCFCSDGRLKG
jgi:hypothetical protein